MIIKGTLFQELKAILLADQEEYGEIFLVGGFVRDNISGRKTGDFDFVFKDKPVKAAKLIADKFGGDFFILDKSRQTARAIIKTDESKKVFIDCSLLYKGSIEPDLRNRDFTINAISVNLQNPEQIVDPLGGIKDLEDQNLRLCSDDSLIQDPVRVIRAVRFIQSFNLKYSHGIESSILSASRKLAEVSSERIRDEICQIFSLENTSDSIDLLDQFNILPLVLPELIPLKDIFPGKPHVNNVFTHTLRVVEVFDYLIQPKIPGENKTSNLFIDKAKPIIGRFESEIRNYFNKEITPERNVAMLSHFAALYHDSAKSLTNAVLEDGRKNYPDHSEKSADLALSRAKELAFSSKEIDFIYRMIKCHMINEIQPSDEDQNVNLWLYRFFRAAKLTGLSVYFLHLADLIATYEDTLSIERWDSVLISLELILDGWFNRFEEVVEPRKIIGGDELMKEFNLTPGQHLGKLLELIRENQVTKKITNREEALNFVSDCLKRV